MANMTAERLSRPYEVFKMNLECLATRYGTPAYVYDLAEVRAAHSRLTSVLPPDAVLYYSLKANPHPRLVTELVQLGCAAEVASIGELRAAIGAGLPADRCLLTGPAKDAKLLVTAIENGVGLIAAESRSDLERIGTVAATRGRTVDVLLRLNPDWRGGGAGLAMAGGSSQFGVDVEQVLDRPDQYRTLGVRIAGVQIFVGSNISSAEALVGAFQAAGDAAQAASTALEIGFDMVDLGGGFPAPYAVTGGPVDLSSLRLPLARVADDLRRNAGDPVIAFEAGRYLTGTCGRLICRVVDIKHSRGRRFVLLDSGIHHLGGMSGLRRLRRLDVTVLTHRSSEQPSDASPAVVAGPLCTPLDRWTDGANVAEVDIGDLVQVPNVGAYGLTASLLAFLSQPTPCEIVIEGTEVLEVSRLATDRQKVLPAAATWKPT